MPTKESALAQYEQTGRVGIDRSGVRSMVSVVVCLVFAALFGWLFSQALPRAQEPGATTTTLVTAVVWGAILAFFVGNLIALGVRFTRLRDRLVLTRTGFAVDGKPEHPWTSVRGYGVTHQKAGPDLASVKVENDGRIRTVEVPTDLRLMSVDVVPLMQEVHRRALGV